MGSWILVMIKTIGLLHKRYDPVDPTMGPWILVMLQTIVLPRTEVRNEIITTVSIHTKSLEGVCFDVCACVCVHLRAYARSHSPESTLKGRRKNMTYF